jgi:zinc/manganese transport system substrate-binding protein/manganese/iron transport system substrate-binding protein
MRRVIVALLAALLIAACSGANQPSPQGGSALTVVTTTTVFADIVANVAGDRATVTSIIPPGVGPEDYEPKPEDAQLLSTANLVVSNGVGLDNWLNKLLQSGTGGTTPQVVLGEGIPTIDIDGAPNPHFWLDPTLVSQYYLPKIRDALTAQDPAGASVYQANMDSYAASLAQLDGDLKAMVQGIPPENRKLVTFHDAFPYLAHQYGFELIGVILSNVGQEPTPSELAALVEKVKAAHVPAVFSEAQFSPGLSNTLAQEAGIQHVVTTLYNDALGPPPADSYLGLMRYDMEQIVNALK